MNSNGELKTFSSALTSIKKVFRFFRIYGVSKTWFKVVGRYRLLGKYLKPYSSSRERDIAVIGCGQFSFSTVGHAICQRFGNRFVDCYDINPSASATFANFYKIKNPSLTAEKLISNANVKFIYITSNHSSHTAYAISAMEAGKIVYVEKPISVNYEQLRLLQFAISTHKGEIFAGYNRPFSAAVLDLKDHVKRRDGPLTLNCFVSGHDISPDHWYRNASEGTRVCGNVGHWIDLAVHMLCWGDLADLWSISISYSSSEVMDDNISISLSSSGGDLIVITVTSRNEPFEGINETINFQCDSVICKIDDFRRMTIWDSTFLTHKKYWPKDVGHIRAILQPFNETRYRKWEEVVISTLIMLRVTEMVRNMEREAVISIKGLLDQELRKVT